MRVEATGVERHELVVGGREGGGIWWGRAEEAVQAVMPFGHVHRRPRRHEEAQRAVVVDRTGPVVARALAADDDSEAVLGGARLVAEEHPRRLHGLVA